MLRVRADTSRAAAYHTDRLYLRPSLHCVAHLRFIIPEQTTFRNHVGARSDQPGALHGENYLSAFKFLISRPATEVGIRLIDSLRRVPTFQARVVRITDAILRIPVSHGVRLSFA